MSTFSDDLHKLIIAESTRVQIDPVDPAAAMEIFEWLISGLALASALIHRGDEALCAALATELAAVLSSEFPGMVSRRAAAVRETMLEPAPRRH